MNVKGDLPAMRASRLHNRDTDVNIGRKCLFNVR
ncbi:hypothetical protein HNQ04_000684 [Deinococcus radiopugnans ATCC 19172]|uniref:Transposase n=1 Tax=Deinococcus radiopugnans ATCC 19172 TaxID=585398 RepID=A0ABR6NN31_9DEIO|nr:hypothetical protein [Deinococcus radiopugnans ATCC 19172]